MKRFLLTSLVAVFLASSTAIGIAASPEPKLKDGEVKVPADYQSWPKFLVGVDRPDVKQVRDIYINHTGAHTKAGAKFPNGTVTVMELYKAQENADGTLKKGSDEKLVKGALLKIFVMGKGEGWGELAPENLKNGDWSYSGYLADGKTPSTDSPLACRSCHLPLGESKDFIARYDEYFQKR